MLKRRGNLKYINPILASYTTNLDQMDRNKHQEIGPYQTIIAEGKATSRKVGILCNASFEKPVQVFVQEGESFIYNANQQQIDPIRD